MTLPSPVQSMATRASLADDFRRLGVSQCETILLHSSLRSLGWVCGGATTVVLALMDVLGPEGTLIVPAQTPDNRDPSRWDSPRIPQELWPSVRESILAFDPRLSPALAMGLIAECVRTWPGARRSAHPQTSFAGVGPAAATLLERHDLDCQLGDRSPLGRLARGNARFLLLGVGWDKCTAFHFAEYLLSNPPTRRNACVVNGPEGRRWVRYEDVDLDDRDFLALGRDYERSTPVCAGSVGAATARLAPIVDAVAYAVDWFRLNRAPQAQLNS